MLMSYPILGKPAYQYRREHQRDAGIIHNNVTNAKENLSVCYAFIAKPLNQTQ